MMLRAFIIERVCPKARGPRAKAARKNPNWFPFTVKLGARQTIKCKCGQDAWLLSGASLTALEKRLGFTHTHTSRTVCLSSGRWV